MENNTEATELINHLKEKDNSQYIVIYPGTRSLSDPTVFSYAYMKTLPYKSIIGGEIVDAQANDFPYLQVDSPERAFIPLQAVAYYFEKSPQLPLPLLPDNQNQLFPYLPIDFKPDNLTKIPEDFLNKVLVSNEERQFLIKPALNNLKSIMQTLRKKRIFLSLISDYDSANNPTPKQVWQPLFNPYSPHSPQAIKPTHNPARLGIEISFFDLENDVFNSKLSQRIFFSPIYEELLEIAKQFDFYAPMADPAVILLHSNWKPQTFFFLPDNSPLIRLEKPEINSELIKISLFECKIPTIVLQRDTNKEIKHPTLLLFQHDEEYTARKVVFQKWHQLGLPALLIANENQRFIPYDANIYFDPNRIFDVRSIKRTLAINNPNLSINELDLYAKNLRSLGEKLNDFIANLFMESYPDHPKNTPNILNIHNSFKSELFSAESFTEKSVQRYFKVTLNDPEHPKNFFYMFNENYFNQLSDQGYNVVLQKESGPRADDGSLSYEAYRLGWNYIAIECEQGFFEIQAQMIDAAMKLFS